MQNHRIHIKIGLCGIRFQIVIETIMHYQYIGGWRMKENRMKIRFPLKVCLKVIEQEIRR